MNDYGLIIAGVGVGAGRGGKAKNWSARIEACRSVTLSTTNPKRITLGLNPGLRSDRPETNRLSHGTIHVFLSLALHGGKFSASSPGLFTPKEKCPRYSLGEPDSRTTCRGEQISRRDDRHSSGYHLRGDKPGFDFRQVLHVFLFSQHVQIKWGQLTILPVFYRAQSNQNMKMTAHLRLIL